MTLCYQILIKILKIKKYDNYLSNYVIIINIMNIISDINKIKTIIEKEGNIVLLFYQSRCKFCRNVDLRKGKNSKVYLVSYKIFDDLALQFFVNKTPTLLKVGADFSKILYLNDYNAINNFLDLEENKYKEVSTQTDIKTSIKNKRQLLGEIESDEDSDDYLSDVD